jgi:hypothetical protein
MNPQRRPPTPDELADAPELAIVTALDDLLELTLRTLVSVHPQLGDDECPHWARWTSPVSEAAERILAAARSLAAALQAYRHALARIRDDPLDADPPF